MRMIVGAIPACLVVHEGKSVSCIENEAMKG